jgi:hypothetical protein
MKIGILCNFYGFPQYLDGVLEHWKKFNNICIFAAASCKFDQYLNINYLKEDNETAFRLKTQYKDIISYVYDYKVSNDSIVRNYPLEYLLNQNVDYIWLLDQDEFYTEQEINNIIKFIQSEPFIPYFKINFKNYFNDENHWIDGFCPPRIFKTNFNNLKLNKFYFENDILYTDKDNQEIDYKNLSYLQIPKQIAHVKHYSWNGDSEFLKNKVKYQLLRYNGICSYAWNDNEKKLELNINDYYNIFNIPLPIINKD